MQIAIIKMAVKEVLFNEFRKWFMALLFLFHTVEANASLDNRIKY